jgi:hypothetical protein
VEVGASRTKGRTSPAFSPALGAVKITKKGLSAILYARSRIGVFTGWIGISTATADETSSLPVRSGSCVMNGPLHSLSELVRTGGNAMGSRRARQYYCRCGTHLAKDNTERQCARCQRDSRDKLITPPQVPAEFWQTEQFQEAFAAQHIGRVFRAYRTHPHHYAVYGPDGISQTLLGQWLGLRQPQVSKIETGPPIPYLDRLQHWARVLRIPAELLWFRLSGDKGELAGAEPVANDLYTCSLNGSLELRGAQSNAVQPSSDTNSEHMDDPEQDPVLVAPWNHGVPSKQLSC